jgi:hypothetical protein
MVRGIIGADDLIYPLGTDTKVLSTVFEIFTRPILLRIAERHGFVVEESPQTVYPDFTLTKVGLSQDRIAIDVKTTYKRPAISYTLGSYTSFLRNGTKNILYPYGQYTKHWVIGFAYDRVSSADFKRVALPQRGTLTIPYRNVDWFVQEKHKIAGESPGSGNTANIGSIRSTSIASFRQGNGPFAEEGEATFREYWANYEKGASRPYSDMSGFRQWRRSRTK